jgi:hypothetical protein
MDKQIKTESTIISTPDRQIPVFQNVTFRDLPNMFSIKNKILSTSELLERIRMPAMSTKTEKEI